METIYILKNPAFKDMVKIGITDRDINVRLKELNNTSVPKPFELIYAVKVYNARYVEGLIKKLFHEDRVSLKREFFYTDPDKIILAIKIANPSHILMDKSHTKTYKPKPRNTNTNKRRKETNFNFDMIGLKPGTTLHLKDNPDITCQIKTKNTVIYKEKEMSLSKAALETKIFPWNFIQGPKYWTLNNIPLTTLRENNKN
jgi:hypothetical protein